MSWNLQLSPEETKVGYFVCFGELAPGLACLQHHLTIVEQVLGQLFLAQLAFGHRALERAGVSRGAPLHHFASKAALIEAAAEDLFAQVSTLAHAGVKQEVLRGPGHGDWSRRIRD